ncbi:MAG: type II toxin-antitoxin system HicB family antitoxin [Candidatus Riflebacteria bacterium]|nr:type II toxin-antitoxin system HicB family antitoxin [Candidatus Riflebacteria bacterium]
MLIRYVTSLMRTAHYEKLEDGRYYGEIAECPGVWSEETTLESCRETLQEVLEEWILLKLRAGDPLPVADGIDLVVKAA